MNDQEYIRKKFEQDGLQAPESLSEERMLQMLQAAAPTEPAPAAGSDGSGASGPADPAEAGAGSSERRQVSPARRWRRPLIAVAACVCLALGIIPLVKSLHSSGGLDSLIADATGLAGFEDYDQLDRTVKELLEEEHGGYAVNGDAVTGDVIVEDAEAPDMTFGAAEMAEEPNAAADSAAEPKSAAPAQGAHSDTYTQVEGVDEADIIKTDGDCIYYVSRAENQVIIARASKGKASRLAQVNPGGAFVQDIYVHGDRLIVITSDQIEQSGLLTKDEYTEATRITVYDISDRSDPVQTGEYAQSGGLISSRMIGDRVCLVTNDHHYTYRKGANAPFISRGGKTEQLPIESIRVFPATASPSYTVIGLMDVSTGKASKDSVKTAAVMGGSGEIYCNGPDLYITSLVYPREKAGKSRSGPFDDTDDYTVTIPEQIGDPQTQILKVSLEKGSVRFLKSATVDGTVNNQFSMDGSGGYFKIATTARTNGTDVNHLFILDQKMNEVGSVRNFARDEHIEAVRYLNDMAYVITYRQTDPLFIIDLSDPSSPEIIGHVKITGFSTLLHPADEDHLLGIGYNTREGNFGEATDGLKLALFDTSDPAAPKVADQLGIPGMSSEAQYNHKALCVSPDGKSYAIPFQWWDPDEPVYIEDAEVSDSESEDAVTAEGGAAGDEADGADGADGTDADADDSSGTDADGSDDPYPPFGIMMFSAEDGGLQILRTFETKSNVYRCIMIDDYIYGICSDDSIEGFHVTKD